MQHDPASLHRSERSNRTELTQKDAKAQWLDQALADQPPATRAKVLDFALKFGVGAQDDDFWILIAAVGFLHTIIETAPQEWEGILSGFTQQLNQWTMSNLEVLQALTNKAETDATQAELIRELSRTLSALTTLMQGQKQHLQKLGKTSTTPERHWVDLRETLMYRLSEISRQVETISTPPSSSGSMRNIRSRSSSGSFEIWNATKKSQKRWSVERWSAGLSALLLVAVSVGGWFLWQGQQRNAQILQWLLYKANRAECVTGIHPPDSGECAGL